MTQAEQVMLRYNYLMDTTSAQQGDFARTSGTWANQVRLLTLNIQQLAATIGQGLISAVLPSVTALNKLFSVLQKAAVAVRNFFYVLTGYKGGGSSGIVNDLAGVGDAASGVEDLGSAGSDAAGGLGDAAKAAEELKNATLGIDELNIISPNEPTSSGGSGGSGSGGSGGIGGSDLGFDDGLLDFSDTDPEKYVSPWAQKIREAFLSEDWERLGSLIAAGLNKGMQKVYDVISWDNVGPKITAFTTAFTQSFNSFAENFDFELLGRTIGAGINTIVNTLNQLIEGIDWISLGKRLATGFMGLVDEIDWLELGKLIGNKFMIAWRLLLGFVTNLDWGEVGRALAEGFTGIFESIDLGEIGTAIGELVAGIIEMLREFFANVEWESVIAEVKEGISNAIAAASDGGKNDGILLAILGIGALGGITKIVGPIVGAISTISGILGKAGLAGAAGEAATAVGGAGGLSGVLSTVGGTLSKFAGPIGVAVAALLLLKGGISDLWNTSETFRSNMSDMWDRITKTFSDAKKKIWDKGLSPLWENIKEFFGSLYDLYESSGLKSIFQFLIEMVGNQLVTVFQMAIGILGDLIGGIVGVISGIVEALTGVLDFLVGVFTGDWEKAWEGIKGFFEGIWNALVSIVETIFNVIMTIVNSIVDFFGSAFNSAAALVESAFSGIGGFFSGIWEGIKSIFSTVAEFFSSAFTTAYNGVTAAFQFVGSWFQEKWNAIKTVFSNVAGFFSSAFQSAYDGITSVFENIGEFFKGIFNSVLKVIGNAVNGIIDGVNWIGDKLGVGDVLSNWDVPQLAKGSNGLPQNTLAVVNDQKGPKYKELILPPNGQPFIPKGRNVMLPLQKGTKIMPAGQTDELMKLMKVPRFAGGIGDIFGSAWSAIKSFAGDVWDYVSNPGDLVKIALDKFISLADFFEPWTTIVKGAIEKLFDSITDFVDNLFGKAKPSVDYDSSKGVEQWRDLAKYALNLEGQYTDSNLELLLYQMQTESGGDPNAINDWDINAKNGTPSKGLMQVIDPTFQSYARPGYDSSIWDPLSNILAAIRYTLSTYGSLANGWKGHGYAEGIGKINLSDLFGKIPALSSGGTLIPGQLFVANEKGPELIGKYGNRTTVLNNDQVVESVSFGVEKAVERQNAEMTILLRQILETNQRILAKDTSNYIDGKKADSLIRRARNNSGYNFRPAGGAV